jgi:hypothetical protein
LTLVRVFIPTTEGPVAIERITREPAAQSAVCIKRTTRVLPISAAYDAFVRAPSGVIEREFGPWDRGAFRLDVSDAIGDGESWQLGVFIAHALAAENRLAGPEDDCAEALWISGALDSDLGVGPVGHIAEKLHASADLISQHGRDGTKLGFFVPADNFKSMAGRDDISVTGVAMAGEIQEYLGLPHATNTSPAPVVAPPVVTTEEPSGNGLRTLFTVMGIGILVAGAGAFIYFEQQPAPKAPVVTAKKTPPPTVVAKPEPVKPALAKVKPAPAIAPKPVVKSASAALPVHVPTLKIYELRAAAGSSCAAVQFSDIQPLKVHLEPTSGDQLADSKATGLCGLEFVVDVGPEKRFVSAAVNLTRGRFVRNRLPETLKGNTAAKGELRWRSHIPKRLKRPVKYNIAISISKTAIAGTVAETRTVTARHRILP